MMKKIFIVATIVTVSVTGYAHSGGTNRYGCHAGSRPYHCHNSKKPAKPTPPKSSCQPTHKPTDTIRTCAKLREVSISLQKYFDTQKRELQDQIDKFRRKDDKALVHDKQSELDHVRRIAHRAYVFHNDLLKFYGCKIISEK